MKSNNESERDNVALISLSHYRVAVFPSELRNVCIIRLQPTASVPMMDDRREITAGAVRSEVI